MTIFHAGHNSPALSHCREEDIVDQVKRFDDRFSSLVFRLRDELIQNKTLVTKVRDSITLLPSSIRPEHYQFIKECSDNIKDAKDIEDIFRHLNLYWTYLEYSLLNHIIVRHSSTLSKGLSEDMKEYERDMEDFKRHTTVEQLLAKEVGLGCMRREPPPGFSRIVTKLNSKPSEFTLHRLEVFRRNICFEFNLPTFILMLESVDEGSLCIKWHIPSFEAHCFLHVSSSILKRISAELFHLEVDMSTLSSADVGEGQLSSGKERLSLSCVMVLRVFNKQMTGRILLKGRGQVYWPNPVPWIE